jgi:hypothetical protein
MLSCPAFRRPLLEVFNLSVQIVKTDSEYQISALRSDNLSSRPDFNVPISDWRFRKRLPSIARTCEGETNTGKKLLWRNLLVQIPIRQRQGAHPRIPVASSGRVPGGRNRTSAEKADAGKILRARGRNNHPRFRGAYNRAS